MEYFESLDHEVARVIVRPEISTYDEIICTLRELAIPIFVKTQHDEIKKSMSRHKEVAACLSQKSRERLKEKRLLEVTHDCPVCQGEGLLSIYSWKKAKLQNEAFSRDRKKKYFALHFKCNECGHIDANEEINRCHFSQSQFSQRVSPIVVCSCPSCMEKKKKGL